MSTNKRKQRRAQKLAFAGRDAAKISDRAGALAKENAELLAINIVLVENVKVLGQRLDDAEKMVAELERLRPLESELNVTRGTLAHVQAELAFLTPLATHAAEHKEEAKGAKKLRRRLAEAKEQLAEAHREIRRLKGDEPDVVIIDPITSASALVAAARARNGR